MLLRVSLLHLASTKCHTTSIQPRGHLVLVPRTVDDEHTSPRTCTGACFHRWRHGSSLLRPTRPTNILAAHGQAPVAGAPVAAHLMGVQDPLSHGCVPATNGLPLMSGCGGTSPTVTLLETGPQTRTHTVTRGGGDRWPGRALKWVPRSPTTICAHTHTHTVAAPPSINVQWPSGQYLLRCWPGSCCRSLAATPPRRRRSPVRTGSTIGGRGAPHGVACPAAA